MHACLEKDWVATSSTSSKPLVTLSQDVAANAALPWSSALLCLHKHATRAEGAGGSISVVSK
eukprot:2294794-Pyramimonas_sp.AAC.2